MLQALRSRTLALATLAAFLVAQPAVGCAALCLFERHHAGAQAMPAGSSALSGSACHTAGTGAVQRAPVKALSPMEPAHAAVIAVAAARWLQPARALPTPPPPVCHTVEPPPPRLV